ncbi:anti-anti-sigma factor [Rhodopirellula sp. SM50]|nr:STAS domain-containing protein [Rhodopirellula sp. SM50]PAY17515.1 anti-anti-sigma factor [Rhodopirellula sp. SM50]
MSDQKLFQVTQHDDVTVIHPPTSLGDREQIFEFSDELTKFVDEHKPKKLQFNFEYVNFFGTEAISSLIRVQKRVAAYGGRLNLCGMTKDLREIFKILRLDGPVFHIYSSCRDATAALED